MPKRRNKTIWDDSARMNNISFKQYVNRLLELSVSMFEWKNLPDTVDPRYIETTLFSQGSAVYFRDENIGDLCLSMIASGQFDVYGYPIKRRAYSGYNNYQRELDETNSVVIWNNYLRTGCTVNIELFARRLAELDRIIDVNSKAQKTPVLIQANETQRLTMMNLYMKYDGNEPFIFGDKNIDLNSIKAISTEAPYVCDKIYTLKTQIWNEALTYLGISNINIQKKERLISDEVTRNQGGTIASRYSRLESRREAADKINQMFGTDIEVNYREDFQTTDANDMPFGKDTLENNEREDKSE